MSATQTPRKPPTIGQFKRWARDCAPDARAVLLAQAFMELERERVDAYIRPIFDKYGFEVAAKWQERGRTAAITVPRDLYLCDDEVQVACYFEECDQAHRAHGFTGPKGHCPALVAEGLHRTAKACLVGLAEPLFGIEWGQIFGADEKRYLDLLIGACLKAESEGKRR